jgi:hypothetical protein
MRDLLWTRTRVGEGALNGVSWPGPIRLHLHDLVCIG